MMIRILALLLMVQLALAVWFYWPQEVTRSDGDPLLAGLSVEPPSQVTIADGESSVTLQRSGDQWMLDNGLPADPLKITAILQALTQDNTGYAIANSSSAAQRFEVADDNFQRRIELSDGVRSMIAYLGTSPAFQKTHARRDDDSGIYILALNSYDAPTSVESWLDRNAIALSDIDRIEIGDTNYILEGGQWVVEGGPDVVATTADNDGGSESGVATLVQALETLRVTGLANAEDQALATDGETFTVITAASGIATTTLTVRKSDERYFLHSSAYDALFTLSQYDAERLRDAVTALSG